MLASLPCLLTAARWAVICRRELAHSSHFAPAEEEMNLCSLREGNGGRMLFASSKGRCE